MEVYVIPTIELERMVQSFTVQANLILGKKDALKFIGGVSAACEHIRKNAAKENIDADYVEGP